MPGHLPVMPPAASACGGTLTDREGKWLLAGALIVSLTSGKIEDTVEGWLGFVIVLQPQMKLASQPSHLRFGSVSSRVAVCVSIQPYDYIKNTHGHDGPCSLDKGQQGEKEQHTLKTLAGRGALHKSGGSAAKRWRAKRGCVYQTLRRARTGIWRPDFSGTPVVFRSRNVQRGICQRRRNIWLR